MYIELHSRATYDTYAVHSTCTCTYACTHVHICVCTICMRVHIYRMYIHLMYIFLTGVPDRCAATVPVVYCGTNPPSRAAHTVTQRGAAHLLPPPTPFCGCLPLRTPRSSPTRPPTRKCAPACARLVARAAAAPAGLRGCALRARARRNQAPPLEQKETGRKTAEARATAGRNRRLGSVNGPPKSYAHWNKGMYGPPHSPFSSFLC